MLTERPDLIPAWDDMPDELKPVLAGIGVEVISTSQGLLTDQQARERGIGGEVLCEIW